MLSALCNYVAHLCRQQRQARLTAKTRRVAYHIIDGQTGFAEPHAPGVWRWFPTQYSLHGVLMDADDLVLAPAHVTASADFRPQEERAEV